ncbi:MAG: HAD-IA family hydrolase [Oscillospiraceae bacterium]|jgi:putative hydrolase of the HAD superfamily|nr:HAD-IA family hydrolase [Oscillospiraceae bacterium]
MPAFLFDLFFTLVTAQTHVSEHEISFLGISWGEWERCVQESGAYLGRLTAPIDIMREIVRRSGKTLDEETLRTMCGRRVARVWDIVTKVRPEILDTLRALKGRGHRLCLVSNADAIDALPWTATPLAPLFDEAVFSCDVHLQKPDPAIYLLAAGRLGARPEDCVFVGDGGSNELAGAKAVGMRTVQARHFLQREVEGADVKIERFEDILGIS